MLNKEMKELIIKIVNKVHKMNTKKLFKLLEKHKTGWIYNSIKKIMLDSVYSIRSFEHLYKIMKKYSEKYNMPSENFATGTILGYRWRLFKDAIGNYEYVCINDEKSIGSRWPAFYTKKEIKKWIKKHKKIK